MIRTLVILCLAASVCRAEEAGFAIRFSSNTSTFGTTSFMDMPMTYSDASNKNWVKTPKAKLPPGYEELVLLCPSKTDCTVCLLYDVNGACAGLQLALLPGNLINATFDWATSGFIPWKHSVDGVTTEYQVTHQLYTTAETLALDANIRKTTRNNSVFLQDQLYLKGFNAELYNITTNIKDLEANGSYTKEGCIPGMGTHYYYNMTAELTCSDKTILTWFGLVDSDQLVGVGFMIAGNYTVDAGKVDYFEHPTRPIIKAIVPIGPECLWNYGNTTGVTTMHTYFRKNAFKITCS